MTPLFEESQMNALIDELSAARADEVAAIAEAQALAARVKMPYDEEKLKAFCDAGEKMLAAHKRKLSAWNDLRAAEARLSDPIPSRNNMPRKKSALPR